MTQLRIGIIGQGRSGRNIHAEYLKTVPEKFKIVAVSDYLKENRKQEVCFNRQNKDHYMNHMFHGYDMDRTMLRIGAMNMMTHGVDNPYIEYRDSLSDQNPDKDKYTLILANPPFKGSLDYDIVSTDLLKVCKTKKTEL